MKNWGELSMKEKSEVMKAAMMNGLHTLTDIRNKYEELMDNYRDTGEDFADPYGVFTAADVQANDTVPDYIGGTPEEARKQYWQKHDRTKAITDSIAGVYGISSTMLRNNLDHEGFTDSAISRNNYYSKHKQAVPHDYEDRNLNVPTYNNGMPMFGLDYTGEYIEQGKVKPIGNVDYTIDRDFQNEKRGYTISANGTTDMDNISLSAATLKYLSDVVRSEHPELSEEDHNRYVRAYFNRGIAGGRRWVKDGAVGYNINNKFEEGGNKDNEIKAADDKQLQWIHSWLNNRVPQFANNIDTYANQTHRGSDINRMDVSPGLLGWFSDEYRLNNARKVINEQLQDLDNTHLVDLRLGNAYRENKQSPNMPAFLQFPIDIQAGYFPQQYKSDYPAEIIINPVTPDRSVVVHEGSHAATNKYQIQQAEIDKIFGGYSYKPQYLDDAKEVYSRLMQFRYNQGLKPDQIITKEDLDKWRNSKVDKLNLLDRYSDDVLLKLFNDVAYKADNDDSENYHMAAHGGSIHINPANKGKFNATKARTGKTTEELTHSSNPLTRKRAIFAQNARKWHHKADGGSLEEEPTFFGKYLSGITVTPDGNRETTFLDWSDTNYQEALERQKAKDKVQAQQMISHIHGATDAIAPYVGAGLVAGPLVSIAPGLLGTASKAADAVGMVGNKVLANPYVQAYFAGEGITGLKDRLKNSTFGANGDSLLDRAGNAAGTLLDMAMASPAAKLVGKGLKTATKGMWFGRTNNVKPELDWSTWLETRAAGIGHDAEDIAALKSHLPEYYEIERIAKENGTWLRMPDGSIWEGDPRSWVQLMSKDAQKHHPETFWTGIVEEVNPDYNGGLWGIFGSGKSPAAFSRRYASDDNHVLPMFTTGNVKSVSLDANNSLWNNLDKKSIRAEHVTGNIDTNRLADATRNSGYDVTRLYNVVDPGPQMVPRTSNYYVPEISETLIAPPQNDIILKDEVFRKSLLGNNGNFSHSTNIYKSILPLLLLTGSSNKEQQKAH